MHSQFVIVHLEDKIGGILKCESLWIDFKPSARLFLVHCSMVIYFIAADVENATFEDRSQNISVIFRHYIVVVACFGLDWSSILVTDPQT
jgi:hypothetical protein